MLAIWFRIAVKMRDEHQLVVYLNQALAWSPEPLARLVFLASLRDPYTGRYVHEGWATCASPEEVHAVVRDAHRVAFESFLQLPLLGVARELRKHFRSLGQIESCAVHLWLELEPYREMIPQGMAVISRNFFTSQLRFGLELLVRVPQWPKLLEQDA